jgi:hypothetical protein
MNLTTAWLFSNSRLSANPPAVRRNTSIGGLSFALEIGGEHVAMRISEDALRHCFGADRCCSTWLATYRRHAGTIDARAVALHLRNPLQSVCLQRGDFTDPSPPRLVGH